MSVADFDIASKAVAFAVAVFGAVFAVLRFGFGVGKRDTTIESTINAGFAEIRSRLDRIEKSREDEAKARAVAEAEAQRKAIADAVRQAQVEEREKAIAVVISELRDHVEELQKTKLAEHQEFRDRLTSLESIRIKLDGIDSHQKGHAKALQDLQFRVGTIEQRGSRPTAKPVEVEPDSR